MLLVEVLIVAALLVAVAAVAAGRGDPLTPAEEDRPDLGLPDGRMASSDVPRLRFRAALRGYRMGDVDEALDRLQQALAEREAELRNLRPVSVSTGRGPGRGRSAFAPPPEETDPVPDASEPFEPPAPPEPVPPPQPEPPVPGPEPIVPSPPPVPSPEPGPTDDSAAEDESGADAQPDALTRLRHTDGHD